MPMTTKSKILDYLKGHPSATGNELCAHLGISRQALNKHIKDLISESLVIKTGTTKSASYQYGAGKSRPSVEEVIIRKEYPLSGLEEDRVLQEMALTLRLKKRVNDRTWRIIQYAFTEILNNAIEHSHSETCAVEMVLDQYDFQFIIRDFGIGVFYSIYEKFALPDENAAVGELIKGKTTTMRERHSGEGLFFTSKSADIFQLRSHRISLTFDNRKNDVFLEERKTIQGTEAWFTISKHSRRKLEDIFATFASEQFDYRFEKTRVSVKLFQDAYISRSEARRLLFGLEKFKVIVLDFKGVKSIGQGFADEVFRVFQKNHPEVVIEIENLSDTLMPVISHARAMG